MDSISIFPCTDPCRSCRRDRCRPVHCFWWLAGWRGWRAPRPHCHLSWSYWCSPHCSCRTGQTSQTSPGAYAPNAGCVQPGRSRERERMTPYWHRLYSEGDISFIDTCFSFNKWILTNNMFYYGILVLKEDWYTWKRCTVNNVIQQPRWYVADITTMATHMYMATDEMRNIHTNTVTSIG